MWRTLANLLGTRDVPALHRLFRNAKRQTWSITMLLEMVQLSLDGKYLAKGYSDLEYDLATVVYELGGGHCLTTLQKSQFAFPSRNALFERRREYKLKITIGKPCVCDLHVQECSPWAQTLRNYTFDGRRRE
jgi:hypothetical protein